MSEKKIRVTYMGEELSDEELPEAPAAAIEDYFAPVRLSGHAVDRASQIVPEQHWRPVGLHTWLSGRANEAFKKLPISKHEMQLGRLKYVFEYDADGPVLKTVVLM